VSRLESVVTVVESIGECQATTSTKKTRQLSTVFIGQPQILD